MLLKIIIFIEDVNFTYKWFTKESSKIVLQFNVLKFNLCKLAGTEAVAITI